MILLQKHTQKRKRRRRLLMNFLEMVMHADIEAENENRDRIK